MGHLGFGIAPDAVVFGGSGSGNYGHQGRPGERGGSAYVGAAMAKLVQRYGTTEDIGLAHLILPDGRAINLDHGPAGSDTHANAASSVGMTLGNLLAGGVVRSNGSGWEARAPLTDAQAKTIEDAWRWWDEKHDMHLDVADRYGGLLASRTFSRVTAAGVKAFVAATLAKAKAA